MASPVGNLVVRIGSDVGGLVRGGQQGSRSMQQMGRQAAQLTKRMAALGAAGIAAATAALARLTQQGMSFIDSQAKLSRQVAGTIDGLRGLQIVAKDSGVEMTTLERALEKLNQRLGEAQRGEGTAAEALERLNLSARELAEMDVDERFAAIADAMRDGHMSASQMADTLRDLGIRQGEVVQLMQSGGDAIRAARQEVDDFGLSVSEVDAAKIEAANDAMRRVGRVVEIVRNQLAIQLGPLLGALADRFNEMAREAGGWGEVISTRIEGIVNRFGTLANVLHGIRIAFKGLQVAAEGFAYAAIQAASSAWEGVARFLDLISKGINLVVREFNRLPGVDVPEVGMFGDSQWMENARKNAAEARDDLKQTIAEMRELVGQPWPADAVNSFFDDVRAKANETAEQMVEDRRSWDEVMREIQDEMDRADTERGAEKAEKEREQMAERMEAIREHLMTEAELEQQSHNERLEQLREAFENELITRDEYSRLKEELEAKHQDRLTEIADRAAKDRARLENRERSQQLRAASQFFGDLAAVAQAGGKQAFGVQKAMAIAQATIAAVESAVEAYKWGTRIGGPVLGAAMAAAAAAAQMARVASIRSMQPGSSSPAAATAGGSGRSSAAAGAASASGGAESDSQRARQLVSINLQGERFSRSTVLSLIEELNEAVADGARIRVA